MNFLKQNIIWLVLTPTYFVTRLVNLKIIPIFTDEAIYAYWSQVALHDPANRFISMEDGKQPLFIWAAAFLQKFITDPLISLRLVSVIAGLGSLIGIYFLTKLVINKKAAVIASVLYIILPFTLLYDRMGLYDSTLTVFCIYAVYFSILQVKKLKLDIAFLNGTALGLAMMTKSSGEFFLYLLPLSLVLFNFNDKNFRHNLLKWVAYSTISIVIAEIMYNSLRVSPLFYIINQKNREFIRPLSEVIKDPFLHAFSNAQSLITWLNGYVWYGIMLAFVIGVVISFVKKERTAIYLFLLIISIFLVEVFFNQIIYARFLLFYFPFVLILSIFGIFKLIEIIPKLKIIIIVLFIASVIYPVYNSLLLLSNPSKANIPQNDADQYFNSWPAGYGVNEVKDFLTQEAKKEKIFVGTEGTFGLLPYGLQVYFFNNPNIQIEGYWPVNPNKLPEQFLEAANKEPAYFIFNQGQEMITDQHLILIAKFQKGIGNSYMRLYKYKI